LREEGQLFIPNTTANDKPQDFLAYLGGGFIILVPFLPIPELHLTFALITLLFYLIVFIVFGAADFYNKFLKSWLKSFSFRILSLRYLSLQGTSFISRVAHSFLLSKGKIAVNEAG